MVGSPPPRSRLGVCGIIDSVSLGLDLSRSAKWGRGEYLFVSIGTITVVIVHVVVAQGLSQITPDYTLRDGASQV